MPEIEAAGVPTPRTVLITGAAGYLGGLLHQELRKGPYSLRLTDIKSPSIPLDAYGHFIEADLANLVALAPIFSDVDTVIHLGGSPVESAWNTILDANIIGTFNVFEASRLAGLKRVIYASSHHVMGFYRQGRVVGISDPPRPDSRYAASKVFGEALGRLYADKHGLDVICLRIGVVRPKPPNRRALSAWLSEADFLRLSLAAIEATKGHFRVVYGVSANADRFWTDEGAEDIGFAPRDNAICALSDEERQALSDDAGTIEQMFQGGWFCGMEFDGDPSQID